MTRQQVQELYPAQEVADNLRAFNVHTLGGLTLHISDIAEKTVKNEQTQLSEQVLTGRLRAHIPQRLGFQNGFDADVLLPAVVQVDGVFGAELIDDPETYNARTRKLVHAYQSGDYRRITRIDAIRGRRGEAADFVARHRLDGVVALAAVTAVSGGILYRKVIRH